MSSRPARAAQGKGYLEEAEVGTEAILLLPLLVLTLGICLSLAPQWALAKGLSVVDCTNETDFAFPVDIFLILIISDLYSLLFPVAVYLP